MSNQDPQPHADADHDSDPALGSPDESVDWASEGGAPGASGASADEDDEGDGDDEGEDARPEP